MKKNIKWIFISVAMGVFAAIPTAYFLYQDRKEQWNEYARVTFAEILKKEIQRRSEIKVYFVTQGEVGLSSPKNEFPEEVVLRSERGNITYSIPSYKRHHNIASDVNQRLLQGYALEKIPMRADSLQQVWQNLLKEVEFPGKSIIRLSITDLQKREKQTFSHDSVSAMRADSLLSYYIGFRYENEATGFVSYSWWSTLGLKDKLLLAGIVIFCILIYWVVDKSGWLYHRFFVKGMPVIAVEKEHAPIYQLGDVIFDVEQKLLRKGDREVPMYEQSTVLLHGFLKAENYRLSTAEIFELLWPDGSGTSERMHTAVGRLRRNLADISDWTIDKGYGYYYLKIPHSIEKKPIIDQ